MNSIYTVHTPFKLNTPAKDLHVTSVTLVPSVKCSGVIPCSKRVQPTKLIRTGEVYESFLLFHPSQEDDQVETPETPFLTSAEKPKADVSGIVTFTE